MSRVIILEEESKLNPEIVVAGSIDVTDIVTPSPQASVWENSGTSYYITPEFYR